MNDPKISREKFLEVADDIAWALGAGHGSAKGLREAVADEASIALEVVGPGGMQVRLLHSIDPALCAQGLLECVLGRAGTPDAASVYRDLLGMNLTALRTGVGQYGLDGDAGVIVYMFPFSLEACRPEELANLARSAFEGSSALRQPSANKAGVAEGPWLAA